MVFALNGWQDIKDLDKQYSYGVDFPQKKNYSNLNNTEIQK